MSDNTVYIGCDDSGFELKTEIMAELARMKIPYTDCGSDDMPSRYPYYAARVASAVSQARAKTGILICGSGVGVSIAANKYKGVRAALVSDVYTAKLTRRHNDSNVLCLGGKLTGSWAALEIVRVFLETKYDGGHHDDSLRLISEMESHMSNGNVWCPYDLPYPPFSWDSEQEI